MLSEVFYWVLNMSITGGIIGLILLIIRPIRNVPRFVVYILWSLVLIRLVLPVGMASRYSYMNLISNAVAKPVPLKDLSTMDLTMTNYMMAAENYFPITYKTGVLEDIFRVSSAIWLAGVVLSLLTFVALYVSGRASLNIVQIPGRDIYQSKSVSTPFVYGMLKPKIVLPPGVSDSSLKYILAHEKVHIKRCDNLWRITALLIACVHWYNPLNWYFVRMFLTDMEFACDEEVAKNFTVGERKQYAAVMLKYAVKQQMPAVSAFGGSITKKRIEKVLSYRTLSRISSVCLTLLLVSIAVALLTNASI